MEKKRFFCRASFGDRTPKADVVEGVIRRALAPKTFTIGAAIIRRAEPGAASRHTQSSLGIVRVGGPLPHVADHVVQPDPIWRERSDRSGVEESIGERVALRPASLPHGCVHRPRIAPTRRTKS